jgi:uncharacterized RDD family membrane protein YckC
MYDRVLNFYTDLMARVATGFHANWNINIYDYLIVCRDLLFLGTLFVLAFVPLAIYSSASRYATTRLTIGERIAKIRVVTLDGRDVLPGRQFFRTLAMALSVAPLGLGLVGVHSNRRRQALHDRLAGTKVLCDRESDRASTATAARRG